MIILYDYVYPTSTSLLSTIINVIMLTKILLLFKPSFGRSFRPKKPISSPNLPESADNIQQIQDGINTKLKQQQKKLKDKVERLVDSNLKQEEILKHFLGQGKSTSQTPEDLDLIRQEMVLNEIAQKHNKNKKQLPIGAKYQENVLGESQKEDKQNRILSKLRQHANEANQVEQMSLEKRLKQKYPQNFIQEAQNLKNKEMKYFNELMSNNYIKQHLGTPDLLNRRLKKGESYAGLRQRDDAEREKANKLRREKNEVALEYVKLQIEQKEGRKPKSQALVQYEDEDYYKMKGVEQFQVRQLKKNVDKELVEAGEKDMEQSREISSILMDEYQDLKYDSNNKKDLYDASSFGKIDAKMQQLENRLKLQGIELELDDLKSMKRDLLFNQKKQREQQLQFQKYMLKKEKKNEAKEYFKKIHKERLREDLDFENDYKSRFKDYQYDPLDIEGNLQKSKQQTLQRKSVLLGKDVKTQQHFKKTQKNMGNFLLTCFYEGLLAPNQIMYNKIEISCLRYNQKKTVINVFWKFQDAEAKGNLELRKKMQKTLKLRAGYLSGKMTQYLGLRYGPDIRFHYDNITQQTKEIKASLEEAKLQVVEYQLRNLKEKGHIKSQQEVAETRKKLKGIAQQNIRNYHNRDLLLSKKYQKDQKKTKKTPNSQKKSADERFWEHVDKL